MELVVVVRASEEQAAFEKSRCLGLTWMDIWIYMLCANFQPAQSSNPRAYTNTKRQRNVITFLASAWQLRSKRTATNNRILLYTEKPLLA